MPRASQATFCEDACRFRLPTHSRLDDLRHTFASRALALGESLPMMGLLKNPIPARRMRSIRRRRSSGVRFGACGQDWRGAGRSRRLGTPKWPTGREEERSGQPLEIDRRGREVGLDLHVVEAAPDRAPEPVPGLRLAVEALGAPEMASIEPPIVLAPSHVPATSAKQRRIIVRDHHLFVDACARQTVAPERAPRAVAGPGTEEATAPGDPQEAQDLPTLALQDVVPGVVTETAQRTRLLDGSLRTGITGSMPRRSSPP